jgi:hypothetical protein
MSNAYNDDDSYDDSDDDEFLLLRLMQTRKAPPMQLQAYAYEFPSCC